MLVQARLEVILHGVTTDFLHFTAMSFEDDERSIGTHYVALGANQIGQMFVLPTLEDPSQVRAACLSFEEITTHGPQHDSLKLTVRYATIKDTSMGSRSEATEAPALINWENAVVTPKEAKEPDDVELIAREAAMLVLAWLRDGMQPTAHPVH